MVIGMWVNCWYDDESVLPKQKEPGPDSLSNGWRQRNWTEDSGSRGIPQPGFNLITDTFRGWQYGANYDEWTEKRAEAEARRRTAAGETEKADAEESRREGQWVFTAPCQKKAKEEKIVIILLWKYWFFKRYHFAAYSYVDKRLPSSMSRLDWIRMRLKHRNFKGEGYMNTKGPILD